MVEGDALHLECTVFKKIFHKLFLSPADRRYDRAYARAKQQVVGLSNKAPR
jgi:hypothetical protein